MTHLAPYFLPSGLSKTVFGSKDNELYERVAARPAPEWVEGGVFDEKTYPEVLHDLVFAPPTGSVSHDYYVASEALFDELQIEKSELGLHVESTEWDFDLAEFVDFVDREGGFGPSLDVFRTLGGGRTQYSLGFQTEPGPDQVGRIVVVQASQWERLRGPLDLLYGHLENEDWVGVDLGDDALLIEEEELDYLLEVLDWLRVAAAREADLFIVALSELE